MRQNGPVLPIGETLREQRIRAKVDMSEVEESTKIRAKYLRALENEEFDVLPGGAYVKSFLKTYADYLGLDARVLLDAYRTRFEQSDEHESPIFPRRGEPQEASGRGRLVWVAIALVMIVLGGLAVIGLLGEDDGSGSDSQETSVGAGSQGDVAPGGGEAQERLLPTSVTLESSSPVWVCMEDLAGKRIVDGRLVLPSSRPRRYRGEGGFRLRTGSGGLTVKSGRSTKRLSSRAGAQGLLVRDGSITAVKLEKAPSCQ